MGSNCKTGHQSLRTAVLAHEQRICPIPWSRTRRAPSSRSLFVCLFFVNFPSVQMGKLARKWARELSDDIFVVAAASVEIVAAVAKLDDSQCDMCQMCTQIASAGLAMACVAIALALVSLVCEIFIVYFRIF